MKGFLTYLLASVVYHLSDKPPEAHGSSANGGGFLKRTLEQSHPIFNNPLLSAADGKFDRLVCG